MKSRTRCLFKSRLFKKRPSPATQQISLQITSMADVFTILLVFLLKSSASDALAISPSSETRLPEANRAGLLREDTLQVELSRAGILVNKEFVTNYHGFEKPLGERLAKERNRQKQIAAANSGVRSEQSAIILSDMSIPFSVLKSTLKALSQNGYSSIQFGVSSP